MGGCLCLYLYLERHCGLCVCGVEGAGLEEGIDVWVTFLQGRDKR